MGEQKSRKNARNAKTKPRNFFTYVSQPNHETPFRTFFAPFSHVFRARLFFVFSSFSHLFRTFFANLFALFPRSFSAASRVFSCHHFPALLGPMLQHETARKLPDTNAHPATTPPSPTMPPKILNHSQASQAPQAIACLVGNNATPKDKPKQGKKSHQYRRKFAE